MKPILNGPLTWACAAPTSVAAAMKAARLLQRARRLIMEGSFECTWIAGFWRPRRAVQCGHSPRPGTCCLSWSPQVPCRETTMTTRAQPPFRADHVGSFLRPRRLLEARAHHATGEISAEALRVVEDDAIAEIVEFQEDIGLKS